MIASLPMYDWRHKRAANDALWDYLAAALRQSGFAAPAALSRPADLHRHWVRPSLLLSQTCAMPFRLGLWRHVQVLGALDYGVAGCAAAEYCSVLIIAKSDSRTKVAEYDGATAAINARNSQSGFAALARAAALGNISFASVHKTGAHAASIAAVTQGLAEIAAIDCVTWHLAQEVMPECSDLRVLTMTEPTPGLPLICAKGLDSAKIRACLGAAFAELPSDIAHALGIRGFVPRTDADYRNSPW